MCLFSGFKRVFTLFNSSLRILSLFTLLLFTACNEVTLHEGLSEKEANKCIMVLEDQGIHAQKVKGGKAQEVSWSVQVPSKNANSANKVLIENDLPRKSNNNAVDACKNSIISSPEQERCNELLRKKEEIITSLEKLDGVIRADVILNIPYIPPFSTETQPSKRPTASVVLKVRRASEGVELTEPLIQRQIAHGVENLDPRDVSVIINYLKNATSPQQSAALPANLMSIGGLRIDSSSKTAFKLYALVILVLLLAISAGLIFTLLRLIKLRKELKTYRGGSTAFPDRGTHLPAIEQPHADQQQLPGPGQTV